MAIDTPAPRSRRAVIGAALGGLGGLLASSLGRPAPVSADDPNDVVKNQDNATTALTSITLGSAGASTFAAINPSGIGVGGTSNDNTPSEFPDGSHRTGVYATSGSTANANTNTDEVGVYGFSDISFFSAGVWGETGQGIGVFGTSDASAGGWGVYGTGSVGVLGDVGTNSTGVYGFAGATAPPSPPAGGIGVYARGVGAGVVALKVDGKAQFSRSGKIAVAAGKTSVVKNLAGVSTNSTIIAVLQTAETGTWVRAAVPGSGKFTVYFNRALPTNSSVGFFVIN